MGAVKGKLTNVEVAGELWECREDLVQSELRYSEECRKAVEHLYAT